MKFIVKSLFADRRAVSSLEYGIVAGVLGLAMIAIFKAFGADMSTLFHHIGKSI